MLKNNLLRVIKVYQIFCSPLLGDRCRFFPSCSHYAVTCLQLYCLPQALLKIVFRLSKCNPLCRGGIDLP